MVTVETLLIKHRGGVPSVSEVRRLLGVSSRRLGDATGGTGLPRPKRVLRGIAAAYVAHQANKSGSSMTECARLVGIDRKYLGRMRREFSMGSFRRHTTRDEVRTWALAMFLQGIA